MNNHIKFEEWIKEVRQSLHAPKKIEEDEPIIILDTYNMEITETLIRMEHDRHINIHDLDAYLNIQDKNDRRWQHLQGILHDRYGQEYQKEVLKEIALDKLFKEADINELCCLIREHEGKTGDPIL